MAETEMVERVARALFKQSVYLGYNDETIRNEWMRTASIHRAAARAAIEAMREPTDAMKAAMDEHAGTIAPEYAYEAAIDAALSPPSKD